ncbi:MAG: spore coat protein [Bacillales bacterium]|jgi:spore coat protein X|nr:spore coat protein [Bacillales bacterium]
MCEGYIFNPNGYGYLPVSLCNRQVGNEVFDLEPTLSGTISQFIGQGSNAYQLSEELICIRNSIGVTVTTTDVKVALNLQAVIQAVILIILLIVLDDEAAARTITQELIQKANIKQITRQKTIIENSNNVVVTTIDAQVAVNLNLVLQLLIALIAVLEL